MRERRPSLLAFAIAALGASLAAQAPAGIHSSKRLHLHFHSGALPPALAVSLGKAAMAATEKAWPLVDRALGTSKLQIANLHWYADRAEYERVIKPRSKRSYIPDHLTEQDGRTGHLWLRPALAPADFEQIGLPAVAIDDLVRAVGRLAAQMQLAPHEDEWTVEAIGMHVGELLLNPTRKGGLVPLWDHRRVKLHEIVVEGGENRWDRFVGWVPVCKSRETWEWQQRWLGPITEQMTQVASDWPRRLIARITATSSSDTPADKRSQFCIGLLGEAAKADARFAKLLRGYALTHRHDSPLFEFRDGALLITGAETDTASMWCRTPPPRGDYRIAARATLGKTDQEFRIQLDWNGTDLIGVLVSRRKLTISRWVNQKQVWEDLAMAGWPPPGPPGDQPFDLSIAVTRKTLAVSIGGTELVTWDCETRPMHGEWGIASNGVAMLADLRCEPLVGK
ncbi:MAG: hypothetical protein IPK26_06090 [Planctomycetes bacterium]|nr:hypothetical protein [Planctomycetota bacterium]